MKMSVKARLAKRCPCCGSEHIVVENPKWLKYHDLKCLSIACADCKMGVTGYVGAGESLANAYQSALMRWNRRLVC